MTEMTVEQRSGGIWRLWPHYVAFAVASVALACAICYFWIAIGQRGPIRWRQQLVGCGLWLVGAFPLSAYARWLYRREPRAKKFLMICGMTSVAGTWGGDVPTGIMLEGAVGWVLETLWPEKDGRWRWRATLVCVSVLMAFVGGGLDVLLRALMGIA